MAIRVACPACQSQYDIEESFRGKQVGFRVVCEIAPGAG